LVARSTKCLQEAVNADLPRAVTTTGVRELEVPGQDGQTLRRRFVTLEVEQLPPRQPDCAYFMHGDPGVVNDAFAVCVCHVTAETAQAVDGDGTARELKKVVVDCVLTWEPRANTPVAVLNVAEVMLRLARYYGIRRVTFDKWNSANVIGMFLEAGIMADDLSFSGAQQLAMFRNLKLLIYNGMFEMPPDEKVVQELQYLKLVNGRITHDVMGKDRADAVAAASWVASGQGMSALRKLVAETIGEGGHAGSATIGFTF
jgi:phage terminase large subunit-like protein